MRDSAFEEIEQFQFQGDDAEGGGSRHHPSRSWAPVTTKDS
jgi:hypothetical protein